MYLVSSATFDQTQQNMNRIILRLITTFATWLTWGIILSLSLLLAHNAILYFTHGGEYGILPEKIFARTQWIWRISFYVHLPAGIICLLTPFYLFARRAFGLKRHHSSVGKLYTWITLAVVCPTGVVLALYAKGGLVTQVGFLVQGLLLAIYTWRGYSSILRKDIVDHFHFVVRSYAMAAVVITFRVLHIVFFILDVPYQDNYAISQWLGLLLNLFAAELFIALRNRKTFSHTINPI